MCHKSRRLFTIPRSMLPVIVRVEFCLIGKVENVLFSILASVQSATENGGTVNWFLMWFLWCHSDNTQNLFKRKPQVLNVGDS